MEMYARIGVSETQLAKAAIYCYLQDLAPVAHMVDNNGMTRKIEKFLLRGNFKSNKYLRYLLGFARD